MKQILFFVSVAIIAWSVCSCKKTANDSHANGDWQGTYSGTVPCADCPGINVEITLNSDLTYIMNLTYIDGESIAPVSGSFTWNSTGTAIDLQGVNEGGGFEHFSVQENKLILLSTTGEAIESISGHNYTLTKTGATR
jgi:uncharacterized lipoprotein NlpE involved in copper resistance